MSNPSPLTHPPFHHIKDNLNHKYAYLRCNLAEVEPKITQPIAEKPLETEICFSMHHSWASLRRHFSKTHNLTLHEGIDCCSGCQHIFPSNFIAITHWLQKALNYQHTFLSNVEKPEYCEACLNAFEKVREAYQHFSSEIRFDDPLSEKIKNRHKALGDAFAQPDPEEREMGDDERRVEESEQSEFSD